MRDWAVNLLLVLGAALVAVGVGLVYLPAGVAALGAFLLAAAYLLAVGVKH